MKKLKKEIEALEQKALEYERNADYGRVAEIRYRDIPEKMKSLEELEQAHVSD